MQQGISAFLLLVVAVPKLAYGQTTVPGEFKPLNATATGIHLYGVTIFSGYYSGETLLFQTSAPSVSGPLPADLATGVTASFGWNKVMEKSAFSASYSPSAFKSFRNTQLDTLNHTLFLSGQKQLTRKWTISLSGAGIISNLEQLLFAQPAFSAVASLPTTFDDLSSSILTGQFTNSQLASILTGAPVLESPAQTFLYGNRILSTSLHTGLTYAVSGRSTLHVSGSGSRMQRMKNPGTSADTSSHSNPYLVPQTSAVGVSMGWSYSWTPRTHLGVEGGTNHMLSRVQTGYGTTVNFSIGRTMSRRWFLQAQGGVGMLTYTHLILSAPRSTQYLVGGSIGFKTRAHTFLASCNRSLGDGYGLGSGSTLASSGAWNWRRPGSGWALFSSFQYQSLSNSLLTEPGGWRSGAGLARTLRSNMFLNLQYGYSKLPVYSTFAGRDLTQKGVVLSLAWSPSTYR